ncbi:MAG: 2'-5' RNA ligase [Candidatus Buchananbacteria bacterium RIFCSPHIGHO2_01_FULL_39_8]|uniref:RNA 2',3'-cyclic phosphodiesterase n=1 Tax=Candidatus Buchananbacteria bacterium RIFCSPHIGHO2_01_FULL_39_8 TaxID=1797533 RepID=A0A1G1Y0Z7_9BACT|nr:hypothetical protein [uncultured bacterium]OGY45864.1 MAG: 2'-5' RNA ligase [Candidatus Buchananbacteria bacterium RIFCSPHIGHO2_01_FULL_39_8]
MTKRCFIAINLPQSAKDQLAELLKQLKKINSAQEIRYVKAKNIHLTLHFLGNLKEQQIGQVQEILKHQAKKHQAKKLVTDKIDAFPDLKRPRVIFLGSEKIGEESLASLQNNLGQDLEKIGIEIDHRPWHAHLTLARIVGPCQFKTQNLNLPKLEIPINSVELMESQLSPYGAEYKILTSFTLKESRS